MCIISPYKPWHCNSHSRSDGQAFGFIIRTPGCTSFKRGRKNKSDKRGAVGEREVLFRRNYEPLYETLADSTDRTRSIACPCKAFSLVLHLLRCALTPFMPLRTESDRETNSLLRGGLGCRNGLLLQINTGLPLALHQGKMANKGGSLQNLSAYESNMKHKLCGICLRFKKKCSGLYFTLFQK